MDTDREKLTPSWRRKTVEERQRGELALRVARFNPVQALTIGGIAAAVGAGIGLIGVFADGGVAYAWVFLSLGAGVFGVMAGVFSYLLQVLGLLSRSPRVRMGICGRCFRLTLDGTRDVCDCGGTFEDADGWTLNRCPRCGYDLRGGNERCPECGAELAAFRVPAA